jgi:hypothetical protein
MIREVKIKKTRNKKIAKFKNNKKNSISKYEGKKTKINVNHNNHNHNNNHNNHNHKHQKGGNKEKFEIVKLADIDYSNFTLSKYVANDIDWGNSPGKPPTTCCIL